jgi:transposase InsO family protein
MKDEALDYFKIYKAEVKNQLERKIKCVRYDRGGEYLSNDFGEYCVEHGIIHETTIPYSPQSNGVAEWKNRTLMDLVNAMLDCSGLSKSWRGEAILTACFVQNRVPSSKGEITPRKLALGFLRTWGCLAKVNVSACKKWKLEPKNVDCIFLGYAQYSAAYKFLIIKSKIPDVHANIMTKSWCYIFQKYISHEG